MRRGKEIAYVVMLALIAKHLFADSYGKWDRLLEIGVFLLIAYEVGVGFVRHWRATRRQKELDQIVTSLGQFMDAGQELQRNVPETKRTPSGIQDDPQSDLWMMTANMWSAKANTFLADHSSRAASAFMLVHNESYGDIVVPLPSGRSVVLAGDICDAYRLLLNHLTNLRQIMEKPKVYF